MSVVIPVFDAAALVVEAAGSALAQTWPRVEVVVVDDGSSDRPAQALGSLAAGNALRFVRQENRGAAAARNRGVSEARGDYVHFLDADDTLDPEAVERKLAAFAAVPDADLCCSRYRIDGAPAGPPLGDAACPTRDLLGAWVRRHPFHTSTLMAPRWLLVAEPFDETFRQGEDSRLWFRLGLRGAVVAAIDAPLATRRVRATGLSRTETAIGPAIFAMALVEMLERPALWPRLGPLLARMRGRGRWAAIGTADEPHLVQARIALVDRVKALRTERPGGLSPRPALALLAAEVPEDAPGPILVALRAAVGEALFDAAQPTVADLRLWLGEQGTARSGDENEPALACLLAWLDARARRGALAPEVAALVERFPDRAASRGVRLAARAPRATGPLLIFASDAARRGRGLVDVARKRLRIRTRLATYLRARGETSR